MASKPAQPPPKGMHDAKSLASLVGMSEADVRSLTKKGILSAQDGLYDPARALVSITRHLVKTRDVAEAKAREARAKAELEERKLQAVTGPAQKVDGRSKYAKWSPALGERICVAMEEGVSMPTAAKREGVTEGAVRKWAREKPDFGTRYALARERQIAAYQDEIDKTLEAADEAALDPVNATARLNACRLRIDTRKWMLSKVLPKTYGERIEVTGSAVDGTAVVAAVDSRLEAVLERVAERQARYARMLEAEAPDDDEADDA